MKPLLALLALAALAPPPARAAPLDDKQMHDVLAEIDARSRNAGDYHSLVYIENKEKDKVDVIYEAEVFRRGADKKFMILFLKPKAEAGKGYLRVDDNLWMYDPTVGRWERRTERERIGGTNSRRSDFDESRLAEEFTPQFVGEGKLGVYDVWQLKLTVKPGIDVAFPVVQLWVDKATNNVLKRQEFALSGRLMRTSYYPRWQKVYSESKGGDVWYAEEMRFFDEVEKGNSTLILVKSVDLKALPANLFTKAWLESKSR